MRIGLQTWGTEGDIRPFFALADALKRRGHEVKLVYTNVEGRDLSALGRASDIASQSLSSDYFRKHQEHISARARENFRIGNPIKQLHRIFEDTLDPVVDEMFDAGRALSAWSELTVVHFMAHPAVSAADAEARPYACLALAPVYPTRHRPPMGAPQLGALLNRALWWVAGRAMHSILATRVNGLRQRAGLPAATDVSAQLLAGSRLSLLAMSPALYPRPKDWDARLQLCGFLALHEQGQAGTLDPSLTQFLGAGAPPAFFSIGSMANLDHERAAASVRAMVTAALRLGIRAIVQAPEPVLEKAERAENIFYLSRAPHAVLFPQCSVIVHHGGAGTTHSTLLAGRPSVVVPHIADQFFWGQLLQQKGVAAAPLRATALNADRLAARIRTVLATPDMATRAAALALALRDEQSGSLACDYLEKLDLRPRLLTAGK